MSNRKVIDIKGGLSSDGNFIIRQDRLQANSETLNIKTQDNTFEVKNFSLFGLAFQSEKAIEIGEIFSCELNFHDIKIVDLSLEVKRKESADGMFLYGCETLDSAIPVEDIEYINKSYGILNEVTEKHKRYDVISDKVKFYIDDLYIWFCELEEKIRGIEGTQFENFRQKSSAFKNVAAIVGKSVGLKLKKSNDILGALVSADNANTKLVFEYYRYRLGKFIFQSPFTKRSYEKPRGYAGDFEMMNIIYRDDNFANTLLGACMEVAVRIHEEPTAVRNRVKYLSSKILDVCNKSGEINILTVASGPAEEIKFAISKMDQDTLDRVTFNLLDQDQDALKYAQKNIREQLLKEGKEAKVKLIPMDIKDVIISGLNDQYDLIYSAGLFDYFSDPVASRACKALFKSLKKNSKIVIGNFNADAPNAFGMLALFDWFLILRSQKDLIRIFNVNGAKLNIEAEPENVNLFCVIESA